MLSAAVSDDLCYGYGFVSVVFVLCVFICAFLRPEDKVDMQGYKNRVFYV